MTPGRPTLPKAVSQRAGADPIRPRLARVHERIDELAGFTLTSPEVGITREAYTPLYVDALRRVEQWMAGAGLATRTDQVGNLFGTWKGADPSLPGILTGSHVDTTLHAGRYDGVLGVLGAIAAVEVLRAAGIRPERSITIVAITAEEPRFVVGCIGSRALAGVLTRKDIDGLTDRDGTCLAQAMEATGLDTASFTAAELEAGSFEAFLELHIEQGARLEREGTQIGIVDAIAAPHDIRLRITGHADHAGATPMSMRSDAFLGAAEITLAVEAAATATGSDRTVGTVGRIEVKPNAINVIPGETTLDVDVRDTDAERRAIAVNQIVEAASEICARRGLTLSSSTLNQDQPVPCDPRLQATIVAACQELGVSHARMSSGAFHDAMFLATKMPIAMLFVPSRAGISHHPDEYTAPDEIEQGVRVLANVLARLTNSAGGERA